MSMEKTKLSPKVSVIIPVYNAEAFLEECLKSVLAQTMWDIEVICVDDGSKDSSVDILYSYAETDERLKVIVQKNQGAGAARNNGMAIASGEYLSFLDADDFFEADMLESAYFAAHKVNADVCVFNADLYNTRTGRYQECTWAFRKQYFPADTAFDPRAEEIRDNIFRMFNGWPWDKLFRREYIQKMNLQYQNLRTTNDMFFVFIGLARARRIITVDKVLVHQRIEVQSSLSRTREKSWDCFYIALLAMQEELRAQGLYEIYERAFVNWAVNFSLWQFNTMQGDAYAKTYELLKEEGFDKLDITRHDRSYFYSPAEYNLFLNIYTKPMNKFLIERKEDLEQTNKKLNDRVRFLEREKQKLEKEFNDYKAEKGKRRWFRK